jgi:hypothetical protein
VSQSMHWGLESVFSDSVTFAVFQEWVELSAQAEVPMVGTERQPRRGNRWYPTMITMEVSHDHCSLFPHEARALAERLIAAAVACEAIDNADTDVCGHWWPCSCDEAKRAR